MDVVVDMGWGEVDDAEREEGGDTEARPEGGQGPKANSENETEKTSGRRASV